MHRALMLLALAGCDQVLRLDDIHVTDAPAPDVETGLVAYYPLDVIGPAQSCAADATGRGHDGACAIGMPTLAVGRVGHAFAFDGTSVVAIAHSSDFDSQTGTAAFWIQLQPPTTDMYMCAVNRQYGDPVAGANSWQVCINQFATTVDFDASTRSISIDKLQASDGNWHHIAIAWNQQQAAGWYDGTPMFTLYSPVRFDMQGLSFGSDIDDAQLAAPVVGNMDDVRFYNRVLSDLDVAALAAM